MQFISSTGCRHLRLEGSLRWKCGQARLLQTINMLRVFGFLTYYHVSDEKLELRARKTVFLGFKRGVKECKLWDSKDWKIILSRDVTFDESSMLKTLISQQVESGYTSEISQRVESDASPPFLDSFVSFRCYQL